MTKTEQIEQGMIINDLLVNGEITIDGMTADEWDAYQAFENE